MTDTVWNNDRIWQATGNIFVDPGITLTIEPGTVVKFNAGRALEVDGTLIAAGTPTQVIRFTSAATSPAAGDWAGIIFKDSSADAVLDSNDNYLGGSILRYVMFEYSQRLQLESAVPLIDSSTFQFNNGANSNGIVFLLQPKGQSFVFSNNQVNDNAGSSALFIDEETYTPTVTITVRGNTFAGNDGIAINTCCSSVPDGSLLFSHNRFLDNGRMAIRNYGMPAVIDANYFAGNNGSLLLNHTEVTVTHNLFTGNGCDDSVASSAIGFHAPTGSGTPQISQNTFIANNCSKTMYIQGASLAIHDNNFIPTEAAYDIYMSPGTANLDVSNNYWGTNDATAIDARIYDSQDDLNAGTVSYSPLLNQPVLAAPAFLLNATTSPNPVGIQQASFDLVFSAPMDQSANPVVTFGPTQPYTSYAVLDNAQWLTGTVWRATYDFTSLVSRGAYSLSVSGASGLGGIEMPTDTRFGFTVDYAGQITDQSPPGKPPLFATGVNGVPGTAQGAWQAPGGSSPIIHYRYAIGTTAGSVDVVNWTLLNTTSVTRTGLGLVSGHHYRFSVQAQNQGGLWSLTSSNEFVAGVKKIVSLFLPLTRR